MKLIRKNSFGSFVLSFWWLFWQSWSQSPIWSREERIGADCRVFPSVIAWREPGETKTQAYVLSCPLQRMAPRLALPALVVARQKFTICWAPNTIQRDEHCQLYWYWRGGGGGGWNPENYINPCLYNRHFSKTPQSTTLGVCPPPPPPPRLLSMLMNDSRLGELNTPYIYPVLDFIKDFNFMKFHCWLNLTIKHNTSLS